MWQPSGKRSLLRPGRLGAASRACRFAAQGTIEGKYIRVLISIEICGRHYILAQSRLSWNHQVLATDSIQLLCIKMALLLESNRFDASCQCVRICYPCAWQKLSWFASGFGEWGPRFLAWFLLMTTPGCLPKSEILKFWLRSWVNECTYRFSPKNLSQYLSN